MTLVIAPTVTLDEHLLLANTAAKVAVRVEDAHAGSDIVPSRYEPL